MGGIVVREFPAFEIETESAFRDGIRLLVPYRFSVSFENQTGRHDSCGSLARENCNGT